MTLRRTMSAFLALLALAAPGAATADAAGVTVAHAIAMHGTPRYPAGFTAFAYANPQAPKGGRMTLAVVNPGGFDSFNPFIPKGIPAAGIGQLYDTLMEESRDEPFTEYGLLAEKVEYPADRSWITFHLRPQARFHDGKPVTADDVVWTFNTLREKGAPFYRFYYRDVAKVEALDARRVKFTFANSANRELALIVGQLPVLPRHWYAKRDFGAANLELPLGSGPYRVKAVEAGRSVTWQRVADWWGRDLPQNRGRYNVDEIRYDYYRDDTVALEALKAGAYDLRIESSARNWATKYDVPAVRGGQLLQKTFAHSRPAGMQGFVFNTRREVFRDRRVRQAINYAFDFEWTNRQLMHNVYTRTTSYFANSGLASTGLPSAAELALLEPFRRQLPAALFTQPFSLPRTDGSGNNRANLREATRLLAEAGWTVKDGKLVNAQGRPLAFEILLDNPLFEPHTQAFVQNLQRLGIQATLRTLPDTQQYTNRLRQFDFDMIVEGIGQSDSPGNEQRDFWTSAAAKLPDSRNYAGISDPAVDALVDRIIAARTREELVTATRALDRVLLAGWYVVPHWHYRYDRIAHWDRFGYPAQAPSKGMATSIDYWWVDAAKAQAIDARRSRK